MQIDVFSCPTDPEEVEMRASPIAAAFVLSCHEQIHNVRIVPPAADLKDDGSAMKARAGVIGFGLSMVALWFFNTDRASKPSKGPKTLAAVFTLAANELGGRVLCARGTTPQEPLVVAFGALAQPAFAKVIPPVGKGEQVKVEPLSDLARDRTAGSDAKKAGESAKEAAAAKAKAKAKAPEEQAQPQAPTVLGPLEATVARKQTKRKREGEAEEDGGAANRAAMLPEGSRAASGGLSIAPMVRQGLRSKDPNSISKVLQTADRRVIDSTVAQLSGHEAFDLLQECAQRLMQQRTYSQVICGWMQRVLLRHCAYISSRPLLQQALQPLHDIFEARCSTHRSLTLLRGRLLAARDCGKQVIARQKLERETLRNPLIEFKELDSEKQAAEEVAEDNTSEAGGEAAEDSADDLDGLDSDDLMDEWLDLDGD